MAKERWRPNVMDCTQIDVELEWDVVDLGFILSYQEDKDRPVAFLGS